MAVSKVVSTCAICQIELEWSGLLAPVWGVLIGEGIQSSSGGIDGVGGDAIEHSDPCSVFIAVISSSRCVCTASEPARRAAASAAAAANRILLTTSSQATREQELSSRTRRVVVSQRSDHHRRRDCKNSRSGMRISLRLCHYITIICC